MVSSPSRIPTSYERYLPCLEIISQPLSVVLKLAQLNLFDTALASGKALNVDMTDVFAHLTNQCLRFAHNPVSAA